jgi:recombination protein RecA
LDFAVEEGIIQKSGSWYSYGKERVGQGRENAKQYLREHPDILQDIERQIKQKYNMIKSEPKKGTKSKEGA